MGRAHLPVRKPGHPFTSIDPCMANTWLGSAQLIHGPYMAYAWLMYGLHTAYIGPMSSYFVLCRPMWSCVILCRPMSPMSSYVALCPTSSYVVLCRPMWSYVVLCHPMLSYVIYYLDIFLDYYNSIQFQNLRVQICIIILKLIRLWGYFE